MTDFPGPGPTPESANQPPGPPFGPPPQGPPPQGPPPQGPPPQGPPPQGGPPPGQPFAPPPGAPYGPPQGPPPGPPYGPPAPPQGPPQGPPYGPPPGFPPGPPGPPGPGGFGPYGPPPGARGSKLPWVVGGAVAVAAAVALVLVFTLGGSSGRSTGDPKSVVAAYASAAKKNDSKTAKSLSCAADQGDFDNGNSQAPDIKDFHVGDSTVNGNRATVKITVMRKNGKSDDEEVPVLKEKGKWLVCFNDEGAGAPGSGESTGGGGGGSAGSQTIAPNSGFPSGAASNGPTGPPAGGGTGSFCVTPNGSTPICIPNN